MTNIPPTNQRISPWLKWGCLTPIAIIFTLILALFLADYLMPSTARKALPKSATDVQEYYSGHWSGDYARCLRAKMTEADYLLFAKNLDLNERFDPTAHSDIASMINLGMGDAPKWWNPPLADRTTYFQYERGHEYLQVLKYSSGYAYFLSTSW